MSHLFTLCRGAYIQKRSKPCCTTGRTFPSTLSLVWGPVDDPSQSLPSSHNACPPVCCEADDTPGIPVSLRLYPRWSPTTHHRPLVSWNYYQEFHPFWNPHGTS